ncbi:protein asteroid homolog 1 [Rhinatrema bivittatum]|uniref:protein asteroid homolog 1 n=1 Tax=Rhinatrema bivittatum TaxID=194408 RepID=UPI001128FFAA|nr:protein asteroid homolog 1 [Rhinatrema bivittatum]XP_029445202.1 protein asteroid homolog 1 [Rhinatrema bivittatum]XP_029445204.1 protein asteroid homolog 1 [Rhinatrema bivittatum]
MGIHGLMSYVGSNNQFFDDLQLTNTKLIIDGNNLYHRLYFDSHLDLQYGGDYDSFTDIVYKFFETLTVCNIYPYVVLDGGCDLSARKLETQKQRAREKIQQAQSISRGEGGNVLPLLIREVFKQILIKLQVPFVQCFAEADRDIMTLANRWRCPVLTLDSDFCIFDLKAGYCPLTYFQWKNICTCKETKQCYIPARCFSVDKFCSHFSHMNKALLPLFAVLNGNDYINLPALETFFSKVRLPVGSSGPSGRKLIRIQGLLNWLSGFADSTEAIDCVMNYLKKHKKDNELSEIRELLLSSMEDYKQSDVNLEDFFQNGAYLSPDAMALNLPKWVLESLAKGQLSPFLSDALVLRRTFLHVQVENMRRHSAHMISQPIRKALYRLLLTSSQNLARDSQTSEQSDKQLVNEYDRINATLKKSSVEAEVGYGISYQDMFLLETLTEVSLAERLQLLLEPLQVEAIVLETFPDPLRLPVAVLCYWVRHCEPKVKLHHFQALLMGIICGELHKLTFNPDPGDSDGENARLIYDHFLKLKARKLQNKGLDLDTIHIFCQWQCCLQMTLYLNQLLSYPLAEPDLTRLYSGTLVHQLCQQFKGEASADYLLLRCPAVNQLYHDLVGAVMAAVPPDSFQKQSKSKPTKPKKRNLKTRRAENPGRSSLLEVEPLCHVSNKFESLLIED